MKNRWQQCAGHSEYKALNMRCRAFAINLTLLLILFSPAIFGENSAPSLKADEGYLLLSTDLGFSADAIELKKQSGLFHVNLKDLGEGVSHQLVAVKAGQYYFKNLAIRIWGQPYKIPLGEEMTTFNIEPGKINYMGQIISRHAGGTRFLTHRTNRLTQVLTWLPKYYPEIYSNHTLRYAGVYPDPFLEFVQELDPSFATDDVVND